MISIKELHKKTLPERKKKSVKIDFISYYLWRPICDFISILLIKTTLKPTTITIFSFFCAIFSIITAICIPNKLGFIFSYFLFWLWNISDGVDGNIARYKGMFSKTGELWDATAGYMAMIAFYYIAGLFASSESHLVYLDFISDKDYVIMGSITVICSIFPRLIVQKKNVIFGDESVEKMKDKSEYSLLYILIFNINSINGFASLLLLVSIFLNLVNIFVIVYLLIQLCFSLFALKLTLQNLNS